MPNWRKEDIEVMRRAIKLAASQLGQTSPNPPVGCVIVDADGKLLGEAATGDAGRPHAEEAVLKQLGRLPDNATAYVTLEPCHSRSNGEAGCSSLLISSGVKRVVIAQEDPHPVAKDGIKKLQDAGIAITVGVCEEEAEFLTLGFFNRLKTGVPIVLSSADGIGFDQECLLEADETAADALRRLGEKGCTRVYVRQGSKLETLLISENLLD